MAGQWISVYALGSLLAAIPLTAATRSWRRRPLLLGSIVGFMIANLITALTGSFAVAMAARFVGGVSAGLLWALLAGYAVRMAPPRLAGRAMAVAMAGTPVALSIGVPAGTFLGMLAGWRLTFGLLSLIALLLVGWIIAKVPDFPGEPETQRPSLTQVFAVPGVRPVLAVTLCFVLAHNLLYTYIAPLLADYRMPDRIDDVLLVFGGSALVSIGLTGVLIDRWLRALLFRRDRIVYRRGLHACRYEWSVPRDLWRRIDLGSGIRRVGDCSSDRIGTYGRPSGRCGAGDDRHGLEYRHFRRSRPGRHHPRNRRTEPACRGLESPCWPEPSQRHRAW